MYGGKEKKAHYKGVDLFLPTKDTTLVPGVLGGYYESKELDIFIDACKRAETIVDVGANIGLYSIIASKNIKKGGKIHSFEPVKENLDILYRNIELNSSKNVTVQEKAVGKTSGKLTIYLSPRNIGTHSAAKSHALGSESIEVPMTNVDSYVKKNKLTVDILKIDIEGYDGYAIMGAEKTIRKDSPTLFLEYGPSELIKCDINPSELLDFLGDAYKYIILVKEVRGDITTISTDELKQWPDQRMENLIFTNDKKLVNRALAQ